MFVRKYISIRVRIIYTGLQTLAVESVWNETGISQRRASGILG